MALKVDQKACIGCGSCSSIAPNTFELTDDGKARVKDPKGDSDDLIDQAIASCPVNCISK